MRMILGLGNPGKEYETTPHNAGFQALDALALELGLTNWQVKFKSQIATGRLNGEGFILIKPQTFMNLSGEAAQPCRDFYKLDNQDILVISDDIDLALGQLRYRMGGGHGGHNGLRSLCQQLGGNDFHRLRIGVGRPQTRQPVADYLTGSHSPEIWQAIIEASAQSIAYIKDFLAGQSIQIHA